MVSVSDHPVIAWCERTGYPIWNQEKIICCERCYEYIEGVIYESFPYEHICESCLLELHRK